MTIRPIYAFRFCERLLQRKWDPWEAIIRPHKDLWVKYVQLSPHRTGWGNRLLPNGLPGITHYGSSNKIYAEMPGGHREWLPKSLETVKHGFCWGDKEDIIHPITDEFIASVHRQFVRRAVARGGRVEIDIDLENDEGF